MRLFEFGLFGFKVGVQSTDDDGECFVCPAAVHYKENVEIKMVF